MKSAFVSAFKAFVSQAKTNYNEHVIREYKRITKANRVAKNSNKK